MYMDEIMNEASWKFQYEYLSDFYYKCGLIGHRVTEGTFEDDEDDSGMLGIRPFKACKYIVL